MNDPVDALILDLLESIGPRGRAYSEVLEAWKTSCPRLPVWEEANTRGYIMRSHENGMGPTAVLTSAGRAFLERARLG